MQRAAECRVTLSLVNLLFVAFAFLRSLPTLSVHGWLTLLIFPVWEKPLTSRTDGGTDGRMDGLFAADAQLRAGRGSGRYLDGYFRRRRSRCSCKWPL